MTIRVAVIGAGYMGEKHARIYSTFKDVNLVGICDALKERREKAASEFKTKAYEGYHELIGKVDAVNIATPTEFHYPIARDFLMNGVHVLVEKTITSKEKEAEELIELANKKKPASPSSSHQGGLVLQVGYVERYNPAVVKLEELVSTPRFIECHRMSPYPGRGTQTNVVMEVMIHDLDIISHLVNSPVKSVDAFGAKVLSKTTDIANARIHFVSGCIANITASRVSEKTSRKIRIFQKNSYISLDYINQTIDIFEKGEGSTIKKTPVPIEKKEPLREELRDFLDCIKYNRKPKASGEDGLKSLRLANMICEKLGK